MAMTEIAAAHEVAINPLAPFQDKLGPETASIGSDEQQPLIGQADVAAIGPIESAEDTAATAYHHARSYAKDAMDAAGISPERQAEIFTYSDKLAQGDAKAQAEFKAAIQEQAAHPNTTSPADRGVIDDVEALLEKQFGVTASQAVTMLGGFVSLVTATSAAYLLIRNHLGPAGTMLHPIHDGDRRLQTALIGMTATGVLAACTGAVLPGAAGPEQAGPTETTPLVLTSIPEATLQNTSHLTKDIADQTVVLWQGAHITVQGQTPETLQDATVSKNVDWIKDPNGALITLSPKHGDDISKFEQDALGTTIVTAVDGTQHTMPVLATVNLKTGESGAFGLLLDTQQSTEDHQVFRLFAVSPGQTGEAKFSVTNLLLETFDLGTPSFRIQLRNEGQSDKDATRLVATPKDVTPTASPTEMPTAVPTFFEQAQVLKVGGALILPISQDVLQATATIGAVPVTQVEASATPDTYGVEVGHSEKAEVEVLGVKVNLELVTDTSLQGREKKPIQEVLFSGYYEDPLNFKADSVKAKEAVAEGVMRGVWHAWKNNDTTRESVSFEAYMQMVADYQAGTRPLSDVAYTVFANDLTTPDYSTELTTFDPTKPVRIVFTANRANMTTYELSNVADDVAFGTQKNNEGNMELWIHVSTDLAGGDRKSSNVTGRLATALTRLTWPGDQAANRAYPGDESGNADEYHADIIKALIYLYQSKGGPVHIGAVTVDKASSDLDGR